MGLETGHQAITKVHSKWEEVSLSSTPAIYYEAQIDSYIVNGGTNGMLYMMLDISTTSLLLEKPCLILFTKMAR